MDIYSWIKEYKYIFNEIYLLKNTIKNWKNNLNKNFSFFYRLQRSYLRNIIKKNLDNWIYNTRFDENFVLKSLEIFEEFDTYCDGVLNYKQALNAYKKLFKRYNLILPKILKSIFSNKDIQNLKFRDWLLIIRDNNLFSGKLKEKLKLFFTKKLIICERCSSEMVLKKKGDCYHNIGMVCDFSLDINNNDDEYIFHCTAEKKKYSSFWL